MRRLRSGYLDEGELLLNLARLEAGTREAQVAVGHPLQDLNPLRRGGADYVMRRRLRGEAPVTDEASAGWLALQDGRGRGGG